jgi:copper chaperone CopZ
MLGAMSQATQQAYTVVGMTCEHCAAAVDAEITQIAGVSAVDVDLASGRVLITSGAGVRDDAVRAAVEEAGYSLDDAHDA